MSLSTHPISIPPTRLRELANELLRGAPQWTARLTAAHTDGEVLDIVRRLFDLSHALPPQRTAADHSTAIAARIRDFIGANLHCGVTLKLLAAHLGYSEKYCSDLFQTTMGTSFSDYLREQRLERARHLLVYTQQPFSQIAAALGFSDQFAFSHFFKRSTGSAPLEFRRRHAPGPRRRAMPSPSGNPSHP
ncbi:MAG: AraC family transcriptional regulator [Nitrospiraceae bacterium]